MFVKIHRGTKEIGGSCVEVWTEKGRLVLDIGTPLMEKGGGEIDEEKLKSDNS